MRPVANVLFALVIAIISTSTGAADYSLRLIGQIELPTGTMFKSVEFGSISGIDRDANGTYWVSSLGSSIANPLTRFMTSVGPNPFRLFIPVHVPERAISPR